MLPGAPIVASKIGPPKFVVSPVVRVDLESRIPSDAKVISIVAPPGYGKTVLAERIHATCPPGTAAWLSVDLLDRWPFSFWSHLLAALQGTTAGVDDDPLEILTQRGSDAPGFVAALCAQLLRSPAPITLVLDDADRVDDPDVLAGLEFLVERSADRLRLVVTGRVDPALPLARWRSRGQLFEVREADLRFDRSTARRFVDARAPGVLDVEDIDALTDRVEGWPMGLQVAVLVAGEAEVPSEAVRVLTGTHRQIADYVTDEVLESLSTTERDVALGLSVLEWFDLALCGTVLGDDALPVVRDLLDRQLLVVSAGGYRFHDLIRELLEAELRWRDGSRHDRLHRRAADALIARGDPFSAARHLAAVGDHARAGEAIAAHALAVVDRGQVSELRRALAALPSDLALDDPETIIDVAIAQLMVGRRSESRVWVERAIGQTAPGDRRVADRLVTLRLAERALFGDVATTLALLEESERGGVRPEDGWNMASRHDLVVARSAVHLHLPDAAQRVDVARRSLAPDVVVETVVPALEALVAIELGDLAGALRSSAHSTASAKGLSSDEHPAMYESLLAAGWCALGLGELDRAREYADRSRAHPLAAFPTFEVEAGVLSATTLTTSGDPAAALALLDQIDASARHADFLRSDVVVARARALTAVRRWEEAVALLAGEPDGPRRNAALAWCLLRLGRHSEALALVSSVESWPSHRRIEAMLVAAMLVDGEECEARLADAVELAERSGWVAPLLGHGSDVTAALASVRAADRVASRPSVRSRPAVDLTEREMTLLELLPTHLSYRQMGQQLYVSVNTIKSNLKSIYRKLGAGTRDEAIRAARDCGLLGDDLTVR
ncbi:MAG TPA: LuxR C-terminal-related transcriptional regulator [Ilumatobacter sp.]|nr:LuxR C-terminal-related transcriptional regulator [Ilumatobacter sp.]